MVSTAAFHARVRGSVPGLGGLKETKLFLPHPRVKVSFVGSLRDREVACSASDRQGANFESCVWRTVSSQSSHHPQEVLLAQFSLYVHKGGLKPDSFHFIFHPFKSWLALVFSIKYCNTDNVYWPALLSYAVFTFIYLYNTKVVICFFLHIYSPICDLRFGGSNIYFLTTVDKYMANLVTHIPYLKTKPCTTPPDLKSPHNIYFYQYVPYVLIGVILEALCYYYINLNLG